MFNLHVYDYGCSSNDSVIIIIIKIMNITHDQSSCYYCFDYYVKASRKSVVSVRAFENELGVQAPVGFFDPAGFAADGNAENFARRRQTEIKHGRIAMLAAMGYITPEIRLRTTCLTLLVYRSSF